MSYPTENPESRLPTLEKCLPEGWVLLETSLGWRVYNRHGHYYGDHPTPEEAIKAAFTAVSGGIRYPL